MPGVRAGVARHWSEFVAGLREVVPGDAGTPASVARVLHVHHRAGLMTLFRTWHFHRLAPLLRRRDRTRAGRDDLRRRAALRPAGCGPRFVPMHRAITEAEPGRILALAEARRLGHLRRRHGDALASIHNVMSHR